MFLDLTYKEILSKVIDLHYLGGKFRLAADIATVLESCRKPGESYLEPFVGAANVLARMGGKRTASDIHPDLILLLQEVQAGTFQYPRVITEEDHKRLKKEPPSALRGLVGFGCSFAGKWFGSYARDHKGKSNFVAQAVNSLKRIAPLLQSVTLSCRSYDSYTPDTAANCVVYCDPPYRGTTGYAGTGRFDSDRFWDWVRGMSTRNTVIVSEYDAPPDFGVVWEKQTYTSLRGKNGRISRIEKLFKLRT